MTMLKSVVRALPLLALILADAPGQTYPSMRFQGTLKSPGGSPKTGFVKVEVEYPAWLSANFPIAADGSFDVRIPSVTLGTGSAFYLDYLPHESADPTHSRLIYMQKIGADNVTGVFEYSEALGQRRFYSENPYYVCGMDIIYDMESNSASWPMTGGWCPDDPSSLNLVNSRTYPQGNLVSNGSFENNHDQQVYESWGNTGPHHYFAGSPLRPRSGNKVAGVTVYTQASFSDLRSNVFNVKPSTEYTLLLYYHCTAVNGDQGAGNGIRPHIRNYFHGGETQYEVDPSSGTLGAPYALTGGWSLYVHRFTTAASATAARVNLLRASSQAAGGTFYFDDVMVLEGAHSGTGMDGADGIEEATTVYNGRNRPVQSLKVTGATQDILSHSEYDGLNRVTNSILPIAMAGQGVNGPHGYVPDAVTRAKGFYDGTPGRPNAAGVPFLRQIYEESPIGRPQETHSPGPEWDFGSGRGTRAYYSSSNTLSPSSDEPAPATDGKFAYRLVTGEGGLKTRELTDRWGRIARSGVKLGTGWLNTDYEYDALGHLTKVTGPAGPGGTTSIETESNSLGQMLWDRAPDEGKRNLLYDRLGRMRFTRSAKENQSGAFSFTKYDELGRVVAVGQYRNAARFAAAFAEDDAFPHRSDPDAVFKTLNLYDAPPSDNLGCAGFGIDYLIVRPDANAGSGREFTTLEAAVDALAAKMAALESFQGQFVIYQVFPTASSTVSPAAGRQFAALPLKNPANKVGYRIEGVVQGSAQYDRLVGGGLPLAMGWGPLKGRLVKTITCNEEMDDGFMEVKEVSQVFNYDKWGNAIEVLEHNGYVGMSGLAQDLDKAWQKTVNAYDVRNRLVEQRIYPSASASVPRVSYQYTYDRVGRLDEVMMNHSEPIAKHVYNEIGQLSELRLGGTQATVRYSYHLRGWLTGIEARRGTSGDYLYRQTLKYQDGATPRYDGKVSESWSAANTDPLSRWTYTYDDAARLVGAVHSFPGSPAPPDAWTYNYHDNGVIRSTRRNTQDFTYVYHPSGNRLRRVEFTGSHARPFNRTDNFGYDADGNLDKDESKGLFLEYNHTGRPFYLNFPLGPFRLDQYMVYNGDGNRVSKIDQLNGAYLRKKHYFSNGKEIREESGSLREVYPLAGFGRLTFNSSGQLEKEFYVKDHLGSTRVVYNPASPSGSTSGIVFRSQYEPFGKQFAKQQSTADAVTPKFTGKEHDGDLALDYFGARYYDPELAMWISPDPARQFHSPYSYGTDPINHIDPDGLTTLVAHDGRTRVINDDCPTCIWTLNEEGQATGSFNIAEVRAREGDLSVSQEGLDHITFEEGFRTNIYDAQPGKGDWTIGIGHKMKPDEWATTITREQAQFLLARDLTRFSSTVNRSVTVPLTQYQFDASVSFAFNIGTSGFRNSQFLRTLNRNEYASAANQFYGWLRPREIYGRRTSDMALFLGMGHQN